LRGKLIAYRNGVMQRNPGAGVRGIPVTAGEGEGSNDAAE
jgi:hypothetical protein